MKNATERNAAMASVTKLMGRAGAEVFTILEQGATATGEVMNSITVASDATVDAMEKINDKLAELGAQSASTFATIVAGMVDLVQGMGEGIGLTVALTTAMLPGSEFTVLETIEAYKARAEAKRKREGMAADRKANEDLVDALEEERLKKEKDTREMELLKIASPIFQGKMKKAFAVEEDPFKETLEEIDKRFFHEAPGLKDVDVEKKAAAVSGKFGEFLQTAGLGGTAYIRKTPAIVQLEKQTKLSESMAKSLDDFNASLDDLVANTVER